MHRIIKNSLSPFVLMFSLALVACTSKPNNAELKKQLPQDQRAAYQVLERAFDAFLNVNFPEGNYRSQLIQFNQDFYMRSAIANAFVFSYDATNIKCDSITRLIEKSGLRNSMVIFGHETEWKNIYPIETAYTFEPIEIDSSYFPIDSLSRRHQLYFNPKGGFWKEVDHTYPCNDTLHSNFVNDNWFGFSPRIHPSTYIIEILKNPSKNELEWAKAVSVGYIFPLLLAQHCEWINFDPNQPY